MCINEIEGEAERKSLENKFLEIFKDIPRINSIEQLSKFKPIEQARELIEYEDRINQIKAAGVGKQSGHKIVNVNNSKTNSDQLPFKLSLPLPTRIMRGKTDAIFVEDNGNNFDYARHVVALIEFKTEATFSKNGSHQGLLELIGIFINLSFFTNATNQISLINHYLFIINNFFCKIK